MKKYLFIEALIKFIEIFSETEYGIAEVNIAAIVQYVESEKFAFIDGWDIKTIDDCYIYIEEMILHGFPIWRFLKISKWAKDRLERDLKFVVEQEEITFKNKYICYLCKSFNETMTPLGLLQRCNNEERKHKENIHRECFEPKIKCKYHIN